MHNEIKISVALCTYNGARFIMEQLESIAAQTMLPDEIVVCDDNSSDTTFEMVAEFAKNAPFLIHYHRNLHQLGVAKNFERAISLCGGDIIFLSDQDDVWVPQKIAAMVLAFATDEKIKLVFSNGFITDSKLGKLGYTVWDTFKLDNESRAQLTGSNALAFLIRRYAITGATMAFRGELKSHILPIPNVWVHDAWIACIAACLGSIAEVNASLISYRQHESNVIGGSKLSFIGKIKKIRTTTSAEIALEVKKWTLMKETLQRMPLSGEKASDFADIEQKIKHLKAREAVFHLSSAARIGIVVNELFSLRYFRFSQGLSSAFTDLFFRQRNSSTGSGAG